MVPAAGRCTKATTTWGSGTGKESTPGHRATGASKGAALATWGRRIEYFDPDLDHVLVIVLVPAPFPARSPVLGNDHVSRYEGDFVLDKRKGLGRLVSTSGSLYEGDWRDDKIDGHGAWAWANGNIFQV